MEQVRLKEKILLSRVSDEITKDRFIEQYKSVVGLNVLDDKYCLRLIDQSAREQDADKLEEALIVSTTIDCFSEDFSEILCHILQEDWHCSHEDIAATFRNLKDPATVNCLYRAAELNFKYLEYDDGFQFARKCIKALSAINNSEAINCLQLLCRGKNGQIAECAAKELRYIEIEDKH